MSDRSGSTVQPQRGKHVNFLSGLPNTHHAARTVFCHRRDVTRSQPAWPGMHGGALKGFFDFDAWAEWIHSLVAAWLFVLILALVVAVVVWWSASLQTDNTREPEED
jgi:hypothetical protein